MICFIKTQDGTENAHIYEYQDNKWFNRGLFSKGKCDMIMRIAKNDTIVPAPSFKLDFYDERFK